MILYNTNDKLRLALIASRQASWLLQLSGRRNATTDGRVLIGHLIKREAREARRRIKRLSEVS